MYDQALVRYLLPYGQTTRILLIMPVVQIEIVTMNETSLSLIAAE